MKRQTDGLGIYLIKRIHETSIFSFVFILGLLCIQLAPLKAANADSLTYQLIQIDSINGNELWQRMLKVNESKVIYGDLCGSWCKPCHYYFSLSDSLHLVYQEKAVSFVYLWARSKEASVLELINNYHLEGDHYILSKQQEDDIQKLLNREGFPTYFMIDKKGEIYKKDAPRPGSQYVYKHLNLLLEEQE